MSVAASDLTVFSALYNESDEFLSCYIDNFLGFTDSDCVLVINMPPDREIYSFSELNKGRIHIFNGAVHRAKLGHTLLMGHLESFDFALERFKHFSFFCTLASNSLMVRRFDRLAAVRNINVKENKALVDLDNLPASWWWPTVAKSPMFILRLREMLDGGNVISNQIEGLFACRDDWAINHSYKENIRGLSELVSSDALFPFEEVLPVTFFNKFGSGRYTNICHVFWGRGAEDPVRVNDLLNIGSLYPDHVCMMKWFDREPYAVATALVSQAWGRDLLTSLDASLEKRDIGMLSAQRRLLKQVSCFLDEFESNYSAYFPFSLRWSGGASEQSDDLVVFDQLVQAKRQQICIPVGSDFANQNNVVYLYLENTDDHFKLEISINSKGRFIIRAKLLGAESDTGSQGGNDLSVRRRLAGFLYVSPLQGGGSCTFRVRLPVLIAEEQEKCMNCVVLAHDGLYRRVPIFDIQQTREEYNYYFRHRDVGSVDNVWFGLPIFLDVTLEGTIDVRLC